MNFYYYQAYGQLIQSELKICTWNSVDIPNEKFDLHILNTTIAFALEGIEYENNLSVKKMTSEGLLFSTKEIATFLISKKGFIKVDVFSKKFELAESILLGPVLNYERLLCIEWHLTNKK